MLKEIKIMLAEMRKLQAMEDALPVVSDNPQINFFELVRLAEENKYGIKIEGNAGLFTIFTKPDYIWLLFWAVLILYAPVSSLFTQSLDKITLITMFVMMTAMLFFYRFGPTTFNITFDSFQKLIKLKSNNLIGRFVKPEIVVDFREFSDFTGKSIYTDKKGLASEYYKVIMHYNDQKQTLIYLPERKDGTANQKLFVSNLRNIIRKNT
ncbi:MAG: hypothetical protein AB9834_11530 [Lentimicrobium sp.]